MDVINYIFSLLIRFPQDYICQSSAIWQAYNNLFCQLLLSSTCHFIFLWRRWAFIGAFALFQLCSISFLSSMCHKNECSIAFWWVKNGQHFYCRIRLCSDFIYFVCFVFAATTKELPSHRHNDGGIGEITSSHSERYCHEWFYVVKFTKYIQSFNLLYLQCWISVNVKSVVHGHTVSDRVPDASTTSTICLYSWLRLYARPCKLTCM